MVHRTHYDGSVSHVTGSVNISAEDYEAMPSRVDGEWLRGNFPSVAQSMNRFIDKIKQETHGEILGDLDVVRIPLDLYRARNATSRQWLTAGRQDHPFSGSPAFLAYELYIYKQWLRVYMRSKMIKHNKDLFESLDDPLALLDKLHIY